MANTDYDLIIVGGGMVGASLALSLADQGIRIAIIEAVEYHMGKSPNINQPSYDDRVLALSFGSRKIFEAMGAWSDIAAHASPIKQIHVSDQGRFGFTRIDSHEERVDALGYVVAARELGVSLVHKLEQLASITIISPASLARLKLGTDHATVTIDREGVTETLTAQLVVAADGGNSVVRRQMGIGTTDHDYGQTAIIANISPERPHQGVAYERFTKNGPLALLPMQDNRCSLVWTREPKDVEDIMSLTDEDFLSRLQPCFGKRLGRFLKVGKRTAYPLHLIQAQEQVRARLALIGNAAHTLHPIAGQGFNLGLRDVATLAQSVADAFKKDIDIGVLNVLEPYAQWRQQDHQKVIGFTNTMVQTFSNRFPPLVFARDLGLITTNIIPPLKHHLARHAMGLAGKLPRLARGLPL